MRAESDIGTDDGVCADVRAVADDGRGIDDGGGMNSGRIGRRLIEEAERAREGVIGILDAQGCGGDFLKVGLDEDGGGVRGAGERGVAGIGDEGDFGGAGFFNAFDAGNFEVWVAAEFRAQRLANSPSFIEEIVTELRVDRRRVWRLEAPAECARRIAQRGGLRRE